MGKYRDDRGAWGITEAFVGLTLIVLALFATFDLLSSGFRVHSTAEHWDKATQHGQTVVAKARQAKYADLGYYRSDYTAAGVTYDADRKIPVWESITEAQNLPNDPTACLEAGGGGQCPTYVDETHVYLGATRAAAVPLFHPPTEFIPARGQTSRDGMYYRVDTWVTEADAARRVTVQTQYGVDQALLDGECGPETTCVVSSLLRAASASEQAGDNEVTPSCSTTAATFCSVYVQGGRVLNGATLATGSQYPLQSEPVELIVRVSKPAQQITASWTWTNPTNQVISIPSQGVEFTKVDGDPTRWRAVIPADPTGPGTSPKGWVRPGAPTVKFEAQLVGGATIAHDHKATGWSYTTPLKVSVTPNGAWPSNWCPARTPLPIEVEGMSIGYAPDGTNPSAADRLEATFAVTQPDGTVRSQTVEGQVVPGSVELRDFYDETSVGAGDIRIGGTTAAVFTVEPPKFESCPSGPSSVTVTLHRAIDNTSTPVTLTLP